MLVFLVCVCVSVYIDVPDGPENGVCSPDPGGSVQAQGGAAAEAPAQLQLQGHRHEAHGSQHGRGAVMSSPWDAGNGDVTATRPSWPPGVEI